VSASQEARVRDVKKDGNMNGKQIARRAMFLEASA